MILALETSTKASSAGVVAPDGALLAERVDLEGPAHTQRLLPFVHEVLTGAGIGPEDLEVIVCGLGPGAYTGMRIGVATARALAQASGARLAGVPTLAAVALALAATAPPQAELVPLLDGRRREVFVACYRSERRVESGAPEGPSALARDERSAPAIGGSVRLREIAPLAVVPVDELSAYLARWPEAAVGGDGAAIYADRLPPAASFGAVAAPTAAMVARAWLAEVPGVREGFDVVLPIYGRDPDAAKWAGRPKT